MSDSVHQKLSRVRKPRVHITYDVETGGAAQKKELPFVVGVMGDYSGDNTENKKPLKNRKFVQVDRDNLNDTMEKIAPTLSLKVENTLADDDSQIAVELAFNSMSDFEPEQIVKQVEPLRKLLEARNKLRDLMSKADRSDDLEALLETILQDTQKITDLSDQLGQSKSNTEEPA